MLNVLNFCFVLRLVLLDCYLLDSQTPHLLVVSPFVWLSVRVDSADNPFFKNCWSFFVTDSVRFLQKKLRKSKRFHLILMQHCTGLVSVPCMKYIFSLNWAGPKICTSSNVQLILNVLDFPLFLSCVQMFCFVFYMSVLFKLI